MAYWPKPVWQKKIFNGIIIYSSRRYELLCHLWKENFQTVLFSKSSFPLVYTSDSFILGGNTFPKIIELLATVLIPTDFQKTLAINTRVYLCYWFPLVVQIKSESKKDEGVNFGTRCHQKIIHGSKYILWNVTYYNPHLPKSFIHNETYHMSLSPNRFNLLIIICYNLYLMTWVVFSKFEYK